MSSRLSTCMHEHARTWKGSARLHGSPFAPAHLYACTLARLHACTRTSVARAHPCVQHCIGRYNAFPIMNISKSEWESLVYVLHDSTFVINRGLAPDGHRLTAMYEWPRAYFASPIYELKQRWERTAAVLSGCIVPSAMPKAQERAVDVMDNWLDRLMLCTSRFSSQSASEAQMLIRSADRNALDAFWRMQVSVGAVAGDSGQRDRK